jgi:dephospho-CoA kinase
MLKVGLTGGVGCGKSTVASLFGELGVPVFDADQIARELAEPGQPAYAAIAAQFGGILLDDGRINRALLRARVYANPQDRRTLEGILHPMVYNSLRDKAECLQQPYCILAIPLLIETGRQDFVDRILVVDCHPDQQYERVRRRDGLDDAAIARIIAAQASRAEKLAAASDIIENTGEVGRIRAQVVTLHQAYLAMAQEYP